MKAIKRNLKVGDKVRMQQGRFVHEYWIEALDRHCAKVYSGFSRTSIGYKKLSQFEIIKPN